MSEVNYYDFKLAIMKVWDNPNEIDKSMYYSIAISILLTAGVCLAALFYIDFKNDTIENALPIIFEQAFNNNSGKYITGLSLVFMIVTTFLGYLATTRYIYKLPFDFLKDGASGNVSIVSILLVTLLAGLAILINSTSSLVEFSDLALIITLLLVSTSAFIDKYKKEEFSVIDGVSSGGFLFVLGLAIQKHFF